MTVSCVKTFSTSLGCRSSWVLCAKSEPQESNPWRTISNGPASANADFVLKVFNHNVGKGLNM